MNNLYRLRTMRVDELTAWLVCHTSCNNCPQQDLCTEGISCQELWRLWLLDECDATPKSNMDELIWKYGEGHKE